MVGLVTGATMGLGFELVRTGLERHYQMVACCIELPETGSELMKLKEQYQDQLMVLKMDVTQEADVMNASLSFAEKFDSLDFIVNNAGVLFESKFDKSDPIRDLDIDMFRKTLEVNTIGPAVVLKHFIPHIYKATEPCIINITSEAGHLSPGGYVYPVYSVSKHAVNMYTQKIRNFVKEDAVKAHIRIFMVHPGRMQTVMGVENAQISPVESAYGIHRLIDKTVDPKLDIPFVNYRGEPMPY